jgi:hypothetical protein
VNVSTGSCDATGPDHVYRVFVRAGETLEVDLYPGFPCFGSGDYQGVLMLYFTPGCADPAASTCPYGTQTLCDDWHFYVEKKLQATEDGWYTIVVDGNDRFSSEDAGDYSLKVKLTCNAGDCECP